MTKPIKNSRLEINLESEKKSPKEGFKVTLQKPSKIKKFLDAIGLGKLLDFLTLTFCDVLELLGVPTSFDITLPELPEIDVPVLV